MELGVIRADKLLLTIRVQILSRGNVFARFATAYAVLDMIVRKGRLWLHKHRWKKSHKRRTITVMLVQVSMAYNELQFA
jgi:hypothetical protein